MNHNTHPLLERVQASLETLRPYLQNDGGDIEVVAITEDHTLLVRWLVNMPASPTATGISTRMRFRRTWVLQSP